MKENIKINLLLVIVYCLTFAFSIYVSVSSLIFNGWHNLTIGISVISYSALSGIYLSSYLIKKIRYWLLLSLTLGFLQLIGTFGPLLFVQLNANMTIPLLINTGLNLFIVSLGFFLFRTYSKNYVDKK